MKQVSSCIFIDLVVYPDTLVEHSRGKPWTAARQSRLPEQAMLTTPSAYVVCSISNHGPTAEP
jgi:hypothetical protein